MDVRERISNIKDYFKEMKVAASNEGEFIYVTTVFPTGWLIDERTTDKFEVECTTEQGITYFWAPIEIGLDKVFDAVDYNIKSNREAQEKAVLFKQMVGRLQELFADEDNDIRKLKTLQFAFSPEYTTSMLPPTLKAPATAQPKKQPGRPKAMPETPNENADVNE